MTTEPAAPEPTTPEMGPTSIVGAVLMGGASSRFGSDKALATTSQGPLGGIAVSALRHAGADPVIAVGGSAGATLGIPTLDDRFPEGGPLVGLATVVSWATTDHVLVVACDHPLLTGEHLRLLVEAATPAAAAVATVDGEPLMTLACWPTAMARALNDVVREGSRALKAALEVTPWIGVALPIEATADADDPDTLAELDH